MAKSPGRGSDQFPLRLPDGMREHIKASAEQNGRSMNAEIIHLILEGYEQRTYFEEMEAAHRASEESRGDDFAIDPQEELRMRLEASIDEILQPALKTISERIVELERKLQERTEK